MILGKKIDHDVIARTSWSGISQFNYFLNDINYFLENIVNVSKEYILCLY